MLNKINALYKSLGPLGFARVAARALRTRTIGQVNRVRYVFGNASVESARNILAMQSADVGSLALFDFWLPKIVNSRKPFLAVVPNHLGPAFRNIASFVDPKSRFLTYQQANESSLKPDWVMLQQGMIGLIHPTLGLRIQELRLVHSFAGFSLYSAAADLPEALNPAQRQSLLDELTRVITGEERGIIERHGFKYSVRLKSMDPMIVDEVRSEYIDWLWPEMQALRGILDIGAQIGSFSTQISPHLAPDAKIYSIEPEPENFRLLSENIQLNGLAEKVFPVQAALSDRDGEAELSVSSDNTGGNKLGVPEASSSKSVRVKTRDALALLNESSPIDLIKIDVEGWEYPILKRLRPALQNVRFVMGELQRSDAGSPDESIRLLKEAGFEVETKGDASLLLFRARRT
jgi:FkbM family methyltransferase